MGTGRISMRSLAIIALGSLAVSFSLAGQTLTEHAAAAAGATIGTAAGKPLGTALGKIFGSMDQSTSKAAGTTKVVKPVEPKVEVTTRAPSLPASPGSSGASVGSGGGGSIAVSAGHSGRRRELPAETEPQALAPGAEAPVVAVPVVKEPSVEEIAAIQVGATSNELQAALGAPESRVSIPDDDGHLLEICQYWSKGQPLGTVRLDNGRVVSVQTRSY
jgi:hypothetical protein